MKFHATTIPWKKVNGEKTYFVWGNDQIVLELDENGAVNKKHVRGLTLIYSEDDNSATDDKVFYNYNAHGDVVQLLDEAGTVTKYYQYDSFGNEINEDENDENPWRYCGEYYDKETKTIYLRARYYAPEYGRFTTEDPAQAGLNWYVYCDNEPIGFVDSYGMIPTPLEGAYIAEHVYNLSGELIGGWVYKKKCKKVAVEWVFIIIVQQKNGV